MFHQVALDTAVAWVSHRVSYATQDFKVNESNYCMLNLPADDEPKGETIVAYGSANLLHVCQICVTIAFLVIGFGGWGCNPHSAMNALLRIAAAASGDADGATLLNDSSVVRKRTSTVVCSL